MLAKLADGNDAGKVLDSYNPPQPEFKALQRQARRIAQAAAVAGTKAEDKPGAAGACA